MKLIETTVSEITVRMRYADNADATKATRWIDFQVPLAELAEGTGARKTPLDQLEARFLGAIQEAALHYVQGAVAKEIRETATRRGS